jgi:hypothetical protein
LLNSKCDLQNFIKSFSNGRWIWSKQELKEKTNNKSRSASTPQTVKQCETNEDIESSSIKELELVDLYQ